ncbi:MAG TPA: cation:proton antiporter [Mariprofundaceae bacterium]|nr:cation:proton antiporter [Mariprofundaceae bacterium]
MKLDAVLLVITSALTCALLLAYLLRLFRLPAAVAYILTGLILGPSGFAFVRDEQVVAHIGELGVIMLMFFIGMEVSLPRLIAGWRIAVLGATAQMALSVAVCMIAAELFGWSWKLGLLLGFIISMSSTAVVMVMLKDANELGTPFGQNALGVLLMQDMAIVPIMILLGMLGGNGGGASFVRVAAQMLGGAALVAVAVWLMRSRRLRIPMPSGMSLDRKVLLGLLLCFASAAVTSVMGLSAAFGAFLAGMVVHSSDQGDWVREHLESLRVVFVAIFFLSIGLLVDTHFLAGHMLHLVGLTIGVFVLNSGINMLVLRGLGETWEMAIVTGGLLSQIGEFSFLLAALGVETGILPQSAYQTVLAVIALTLMLSPVWTMMVRRMLGGELAPSEIA